MKNNQEIWKDIEGYEGWYQVSNLGRVYSTFRGGRVLKEGQNPSGYKHVGLRRNGDVKYMDVHRLVALAFLNNKDLSVYSEVNHKDGDKGNNVVNNLEWATPEQNRSHAKENGLYLYGEKNPRSKIASVDVQKIKELYSSGEYTQKVLGVMFNCCQAHISDIVLGLKRSKG